MVVFLNAGQLLIYSAAHSVSSYTGKLGYFKKPVQPEPELSVLLFTRCWWRFKGHLLCLLSDRK